MIFQDLQNPNNLCPPEVLSRQKIVPVKYFNFEKKLQNGAIIVDFDLEKDIRELFEFMLHIKFPLSSVTPISDPLFLFDDNLSMGANNTSGFNYRFIANTKKFSQHAFGRAIDINPFLNPYIVNGVVLPSGATYDLNKPGTLFSNHPVVQFLKNHDWIWGGDWQEPIDYQHFEKP